MPTFASPASLPGVDPFPFPAAAHADLCFSPVART